MKEANKLDEVKVICELLKTTAKEVVDIISSAEKDNFAIGFLQYVEKTYFKQDDQYYFKIQGFTHAHRSIDEVMDNYKYFLKQNEKQGTKA